ncbi:MAG TPA: heavy metal translocating P-type ATPase [Elusimicrobiota bacterium]|jgi:Cu+-exporting ATPase|nr:heavy metal translocating P-type ATPase [Elusimicrobiota bacterium]
MSSDPGLKRRFLVGALLAAILLLQRTLDLSDYTAWALSLPVAFWCARPFHRNLWAGLRAQRTDAYALIALSAWAGFLFSTVAVFMPERLPAPAREHRLRELAALVELSLLGAWLERQLQHKTGEAVQRLLRRLPTTARARRGGADRLVPLSEVSPGDLVVVEAGEQVPLDAEVAEGSSQVEESLWTGSSIPVEKSEGSRVLAGAINKARPLLLRVEKGADDTALFRLIASVQEGMALKRPGLRISDAMARAFTPPAVSAVVGAALFLAWSRPHPHAAAALALSLSYAAPWTLALAAPLSLWSGIRRASALGIEVRNPEILERMPLLDALVLDKKGILTVGRPEVSGVLCAEGWTEEELLRTAMAAERRSGHLFAEALRRRGHGEDEPRRTAVRRFLPSPESVETHPGRGVRAVVEGRRVLVGSLPWLRESGIEPPEDAGRSLPSADSLVGVAVEGEFVGAVAFADLPRPSVGEEVRELAAMGIEPVLASGDRNAAAHRVAEAAGIRTVYAEVSDEDKTRIVSQLQAAGKKVAMVGEGIRDAPAVSRADLGIVLAGPRGSRTHAPGPGAYGAGIDLALESADLVLPHRDLRGLVGAIRLSGRIRRLSRENLFWCLGLNGLLMGRAVLAPLLPGGWPPAGAWAVAGASLVAVAANTWRMRRYPI